MRVIAGEIVDWAALGKVVAFSLAGGVGVTLAFSLAIAGAVRSIDMSRNERPLEATLYAALGLVGLIVSLAALVAGIIVMTSA